MTSVTLYHNPRCSKSRTALQLLREHGVNVEIIEYLKTPIRESELLRLLDLLEVEARELLRRNEPTYRELGLANAELDDAHLLKAVVNHPILMQRPIAVSGHRAVIGRPPERVLDLL